MMDREKVIDTAYTERGFIVEFSVKKESFPRQRRKGSWLGAHLDTLLLLFHL